MFNRRRKPFSDIRRCAMLTAVALSTMLSMALSMSPGGTRAWAQQKSPAPSLVQPTAPPVIEAPPEPAQSNPGLVEEIGKLLKNSASGLTSRLPAPGQALDGLTSGTNDATDSLKRIAPLSGQTMVAGRAICPVASNGAPDCKAAADQLCKEKGYAAGSGVDVETARKCSSKSYFTGQGACQTENFVTRAVCQ